MRPPPGTRLCARGDLDATGARGLSFGAGSRRFEAVVVRAPDGAVYAYENACPHQGTPLEMLPDRFLTRDGALLLCATHGARFRVTDGTCVRGPCLGRRLTALAIVEDADGTIRLADPP